MNKMKFHPEWKRGSHFYLDRSSEMIFVIERERSKTKSGILRPERRVFRVFKVQERSVWSVEKLRLLKVKSVFCKIPYRENKGRDIHYVYSLDRFWDLFEPCEPPSQVRI